MHDGPLSRPRGPHQRLKTSSIQSDHSAPRQIIGSQKKNGITCLPFVGTKSALGTRCRVGACSSVRGHRRGAIAPCSQNSTLPREFTKFYAAANTAMSAALMGISLRLGLIHPTGRLSAWSTVVSGGARRQKLGAGGAPLAPLRRGLASTPVCLFRVKAGKSQSKQMTSGMHPESGRSIC